MRVFFVVFLSDNLQFLEVKFSIYLNRPVFVMLTEGGLQTLYLSDFDQIYTKMNNLITSFISDLVFTNVDFPFKRDLL